LGTFVKLTSAEPRAAHYLSAPAPTAGPPGPRSSASAALIARVPLYRMDNPLRTRWDAREIEVTTHELRNNLARAVNRAAYGPMPVIITRRGYKVAAIISVDDLRLLMRERGRREEVLGRDLPASPEERSLALCRLLQDEIEHFDQEEFRRSR
jgi:prevent-host-death family protein